MLNQHPYVLAADIGGTKMEIGMIDITGSIISNIEKVNVPFKDGCADLSEIINILRGFLEPIKTQSRSFRGISISSCGLVELESGDVIVSPNQHWYGVPLKHSIQEAFGIPVFAATDTRLAVLGEATWGAGKEKRHFAWVTLGTGFGGALFLDGKVFGGERGFAGAFGHNTVDDEDGFPCGCGRRGCLETFASGRALARQAQTAIEMGHDTAIKQIADGNPITAKMVFQAADEQDPLAIHLIDRLVKYCGIGISQLINILDIDLFIIGGGLTKAGPGFINRIEDEAKNHLFNAQARDAIRIIKESLSNSALFGAAANAFMQSGDMDKLW